MLYHIERFLLRFSTISFLLLCLILTGCERNDAPKKTNPLEFTVVSGTDIPDELQTLIKERKKNAFELTFSDNSYLYIIKGYGQQDSGGYNIVVNDFYQSDDCLVFDTELFGPKKDEKVSDAISYPYIVIKTEYRENPVVFR